MQEPPGFPRDRLFASGAESVLFPPVVQQFLFPSLRSHHLPSQSLFDVGRPGRVEGIGFPLDLGMSVDADVAGFDQLDPLVSIDALAGEHPLLSVEGKVFFPDPFQTFLGVPSFRPLPQNFPDRMVHGSEGFLGHRLLVVVRPAPNHRVQKIDKILLFGRLVSFHQVR